MNPNAKTLLAIMVCFLRLLVLPATSHGGQTPAAGESPKPDPSSVHTSLPMLRASMHTNVVQQGQLVEIMIVLENKTTGQVSFRSQSELADCELVVTNKNGQEIPRTRFGNGGTPRFTTVSPGSLSAVESGREYTWIIPMNVLYDMTVPDSYWVKARKRVDLVVKGQERTVVDLESEPLEVHVVHRPDSRQARFRAPSAP